LEVGWRSPGEAGREGGREGGGDESTDRRWPANADGGREEGRKGRTVANGGAGDDGVVEGINKSPIFDVTYQGGAHYINEEDGQAGLEEGED